MTDLKEIQKLIDIKIAELRQQAHFALNNYDYHHKNDELEIIEQQMEILNQVAGTYTGFLNEMQKFNQTLHAAKHLSGRYEQLLQSHSEPTSQHQNDRQHETTAAATTPVTCTKDKFKDNTSKKQLFPPA